MRTGGLGAVRSAPLLWGPEVHGTCFVSCEARLGTVLGNKMVAATQWELTLRVRSAPLVVCG